MDKRKGLTLVMWAFLVEWFQGKMIWQIWSDGLPNNILKVKPSSLSDKMLFFEGLIMHSMEITVSTCSCSTFMFSCNVQLGSLTLIASSSWLAKPSLSELLSVSSPPTSTLSVININLYVNSGIMKAFIIIIFIFTIAICVAKSARSTSGTKYSRMDQVNFFKGSLSQSLLGPFLNTYRYIHIAIIYFFVLFSPW